MGKSKASRRQQARKPQAPDSQEGLNPRQALFEQFYRGGGPGFPAGNACRSAIEAGYTRITAKANCHILARRANIKTAEALQLLGRDGFAQARHLVKLCSAKTVRWNQKKERWDTFEDASVQLDAVKEINRLQDSYPAPKEPTAETRPIQIVFPVDFASVTVRADHGEKAAR